MMLLKRASPAMLRMSATPSAAQKQLHLTTTFLTGGIAGSRARFFATKSNKPKLLILGTGWGSFRVLHDIDPKKYDVCVVSPRNHLLFTPMLASSALGTVNQRSICQPVRPLVAKKNAKYYESSVKHIDVAQKRVQCVTSSGDTYWLPYDKLVVGVGFQPNDFNTPGVKEYALFMKETADATMFKEHLLSRLEEAAYLHALDGDMSVSPEEEAQLRQKLTFVVVGGGPTGVELAGELTDFLNQEATKMYRFIRRYISVHMLTYDLLNTFDRDLQEHAMRHLKRKQQVEIHLETFVTKVTKDEVTLKKDGKESTLKYGTLVWCAGIKPHKFIRDYGFTMNERGTQILVDKTLKIKDTEDIYALGDCATIEEYWLPQTAQVANQQGIYLAKMLNEADKAGNKKPEAFVFHSKGMMAYLGGFSAVMAKLPGLNRLTGFVAFLGWRFTYWFLQLSMRNRFMIATDWIRTLLFGRDLTRFGPKSAPN
mmetsp:Transcript_77114/g.160532  ORF Transcript_77114/g.160532 Transcript_77114/m.160532 type:complete len:482 (+) Transcript_77114:95-1540(+)|eukprot:CAMPEP_0206445010 /NCGR_PEP_ID=MMETSP0324_2-20121206/15242_1 /ASSEMBLY_ACC=CAM_ASM_000836 /TAXON_ID=2866 /ORGANISM="Crypthecodinium cohnii, Strain Seligo" /LENGTH=481 /DNA_ID=CAMNT_0053913121 /DNA_START=68 /DNA_END=1513 /DNA_ORIENTATION=+